MIALVVTAILITITTQQHPIFIVRQHSAAVCYTMLYCYSIFCLSVRPSHAAWHCVKMTGLMLVSRDRIFSGAKDLSEIPMGHQLGASNTGGSKIGDFRPISRYVSETAQPHKIGF